MYQAGYSMWYSIQAGYSMCCSIQAGYFIWGSIQAGYFMWCSRLDILHCVPDKQSSCTVPAQAFRHSQGLLLLRSINSSLGSTRELKAGKSLPSLPLCKSFPFTLCVCVNLFVCEWCLCLYVNVCVCECVCGCVCIWMYECVYVYVWMCLYVYMKVCI